MPVSEFSKAFGLRLRSFRKQHHWSLKELASQLNVQPSQLNKYECGVNLPPGETLLLIARIFHTSTDFLLAGSQSDSLNLAIHNKFLLDRFIALQHFPSDDLLTIVKLIDAFIFKLQIQGVLSQFNPAATIAPAPAISATTPTPATSPSTPSSLAPNPKPPRSPKSPKSPNSPTIKKSQPS